MLCGWYIRQVSRSDNEASAFVSDPTGERPIRILRMITRLNISGPSAQVILLTAHLRQKGYDTALVSGELLSETDDMRYLAEQKNITPVIIEGMDYSLNPIRNVRVLWRIYQLIRRYQPDVVHTHARTAGFFGRVAARLARVPVVVHTFHEYPFEGYFRPIETKLFIWVERAMARLSDSIITLTESLRRDIADTYRITRKSRVIVLPLGLDLDPYAAMSRKAGLFRAAWGIPSDVPLVGIVGRLIPVKNHPLFLQAALRLRQRHPSARFVIVGDGYLRAQLESQTRELGLDDVVLFTGWQKDTAPIYSDLDVAVISSLSEGTPVPVIEALAAACPVVATAVGGLPDLLDGGRLGRLVASGSADDLALAIHETLVQPPDMTVAQAAMLDRYSINRLVGDLDSLYRGLLWAKKPPAE